LTQAIHPGVIDAGNLPGQYSSDLEFS